MTLRKYKKNRLGLPSVSQSNFWVFFIFLFELTVLIQKDLASKNI